MDKKSKESSAFEVSVNFDSTPILYTDNVLITTNSDGVILDVGQRLGTTNKVRLVARIGMSRQHAKKVVNELAKTLAISEHNPRKKN